MAARSPASQEMHAERLDAALLDVIRRTRAVAARASEAALHRPPSGGGWSAAQVFEHLVISTESYLALMRPRLADAPAVRAGDAPTRWTPTLMGRLLVRSLRTSRRLPPPRIWRAVATPRPAVIDRFLEQLDETRRLLSASRHLRWRDVRLHSPVSRLIRLDLGDCLTIITVHTGRHLGQAERALAVANGSGPGGAAATAGTGDPAGAGPGA